MHAEVTSDSYCFSDLEKEWVDLLQKAHTNHLFQTPQFLEAWWENFGDGELNIYLVKDGDNHLRGVFPLSFKDGVLQALASKEVSDYFDFIVDRDDTHAIFEAFFLEVKKNSLVQKIELLSIPDGSSTLTEMAQHGTAVISQQTVCPVIELPATWEEYLTSIGKKQRHEIKRKWKNLEENTQSIFSVVDSVENIDRDVADFIRLHKSSSPEKAAFWNEKQTTYFSQIVTAAAKNTWLKLFFLETNGQRSATMLCFEYRQRLYLFNSGYDPTTFAHLSVGNVLTSYTIKDAIERGLKCYDFLRGDEEYKFRYRAIAEPIFDVTFSL